MNLHSKQEESDLKAGKILIAEPFLEDPNFVRSVIYLCEYGEDGAVGFVLNKRTDLKLNDVLPELAVNELDINQGGPVQLDTLHMLHRLPDKLGGNEISPGVYWGGSYETLQDIVSDGMPHDADLKLFLGYSGWSSGQLEQEVRDGSWLITDFAENLLFDTQPSDIWKNAVKMMGKKYLPLLNMPVNPQHN